MKKIVDSVGGLVWTLAGTGLVLITLSGETKKLGLIISAVALVVNLITIALSKDE
jgi:hypothetical protein